jgi:hypothetical protein
VDASRAIRALQSAHSSVFFMSHPDLNGRGWTDLDEDEKPTA